LKENEKGKPVIGPPLFCTFLGTFLEIFLSGEVVVVGAAASSQADIFPGLRPFYGCTHLATFLSAFTPTAP